MTNLDPQERANLLRDRAKGPADAGTLSEPGAFGPAPQPTPIHKGQPDRPDAGLPPPFPTPFTDIARLSIESRAALPLQSAISYKGIVSPESQTESIETKQSFLGRLGSGLMAAGEWIQRNVDGPIPGIISTTAAMASRTDVSVFEAIAASADFLFTGSSALVQRELGRFNIEMPELTGDPIKDFFKVWGTYGEYNRERPSLFWGEKFIGEMLLSPANLLFIGPQSRLLAKVGMFWPRLAKKIAWTPIKGNVFQLTKSGRKGILEDYWIEHGGMVMSAMDVKTGKRLEEFAQSARPEEMRRRLTQLWEGDDVASYLGKSTPEQEKFLDSFRMAFPVRRSLDDWFDDLLEAGGRDFDHDVGIMFYETQKRVGAVGFGKDLASSLTKRGRARVSPAASQPNIVMRVQQKIKGQMAPFQLFARPAYNVYNAITNTTTLIFRHGFRISRRPAAGRLSVKLGIREGFARPNILDTTKAGTFVEITTQTGKAIDDIAEWEPWLMKWPLVGAATKWLAKKSADIDEAYRTATFDLTVMKEWTPGMRKHVDELLEGSGAPDDIIQAIKNVESRGELEDVLKGALGRGEVVEISPADLLRTRKEFEGALETLDAGDLKEVLDELGAELGTVRELGLLRQSMKEALEIRNREIGRFTGTTEKGEFLRASDFGLPDTGLPDDVIEAMNKPHFDALAREQIYEQQKLIDFLSVRIEEVVAATPKGGALDIISHFVSLNSLGPIGRMFLREGQTNLGRAVQTLDDLEVVGNSARRELRDYFRGIRDEADIEFGGIDKANKAMYERLTDDLDDLVNTPRTNKEVGAAVKTQVNLLREQQDTFLKNLQGKVDDYDRAYDRAARSVMGETNEAWKGILVKLAAIRTLKNQRDLTQISRYYGQLLTVVPEEAARRVPELSLRNAARRTKIFDDGNQRSIKTLDEFAAEMEKIPESLRSGVMLSDLTLPSRLPATTQREILEQVGLDPKIYDPDTMPDIGAFVQSQMDDEISKLDDTIKMARRSFMKEQRIGRPAGAFTDEHAELARRAFNANLSKVERRAVEVTQQDYFNYRWRNYADYFENHMMPYPFWAVRYLNYWITRTVQNPNQARIALRAVSEWKRAVEDEPPHLRMSAKLMTLSDGTQVRWSPWGGLFPLGYPILDVMEPGRESEDLAQVFSRISDFTGGFFYPTTELLLGLADQFEGLEDVPVAGGIQEALSTRTGARGLTRPAKDIMLDIVPQLSLMLTGINSFGYDEVTAVTRDMTLNEFDKNSIKFAMMDDLNSGKLTDVAGARKALDSLEAGQPNALAAMYAKKALGKRFFSKISSYLGMPLRLVTPGEFSTAEARSIIVPKLGEKPATPEEVEAVFAAHPGLQIMQGAILPSGLTTRQTEQFKLTTTYWNTVRKMRETRDDALWKEWRRFQDRTVAFSGMDYRDARSKILATYMGAITGALEGTLATAVRAGLPLDTLPLPITEAGVVDPTNAALGRLKRQAFWADTGRPIYPDNPLRFVEDGYYAISADDFRSAETGIIDWSSFYAMRQDYFDVLPRGESEWLLARIYDSDAPDAQYRLAQEAAKPFWMQRDLVEQADPRIRELLTSIKIAEKPGGDRRFAERLKRHPVLRRANALIDRKRKLLRRSNKVVDAALVIFWGYTPVHRDWENTAKRAGFI